jgi:hypothetical protein
MFVVLCMSMYACFLPLAAFAWAQERQQQMRFSLAQLEKAPYGNILFAGG